MMVKKVVLSNLGIDITEATITSLIKQEGEKIKRGDVIATVESQKVSFEIVSPSDGFLLKILCKEGDTVKVGETVAIMGKEGEDISSLLEKGVSEEPKEDKELKPKKEIFTKTEKIYKVKAYPAARKLAQELNLDFSQIEGNDPGGLITKKDIERYFEKQGISEVIPLRGTRAIIARHMVESLQTAAHVTTVIEIDMTLVKNLREEFREKKNLRLSYLPFIIKAAVKAIQDVPIINSIIREDRILKKKEVNFGIAIGSEEALLVPVIRHVETMDLIEISQTRESNYFSQRKETNPGRYARRYYHSF